MRSKINVRTVTALAVACSAWLWLTGCEPKVNKGLDGQILTDEEGKLWNIEHNMGATYFLTPVKTNLVLKAKR